MARKLRKIPQPPIDPTTRSTETRSGVAGILLLIAGGALVFYAAGRLIAVGGEPGQTISEPQLVRYVTRGAVKRVVPEAPQAPEPIRAPLPDANGPIVAAGPNAPVAPAKQPPPAKAAEPKIQLQEGDDFCPT
jgi:hypothetical protein